MRGPYKPKDDPTLREAIDAAFKNQSPEAELAILLDTLHQEFRSDQSTAFPAFEAVRTIAAQEWGRKDGLERIPTASVQVPWWVIQALAIGFNKYADARAKGGTTQLGEAYGLEGGGQGKPPRVTKAARSLSNKRLVMGIAKREQQGMTVRAAIEAVIAETGTPLSFKRVEKIWSSYREKARAIRFD